MTQKTVTLVVPEGYATGEEFAKDCGFEMTGTAKERWEHIAGGTTYTVEGRAQLQVTCSSCDNQEMILYRSEKDGRLWCRPVREFMDGRFRRLADARVLASKQ